MNNQQAAATPPVCVAAHRGNIAMLRKLLNGGASVNEVDPRTDYRPLQLAARGGHVACLALILEQPGVDINESVGHPFGTTSTGPGPRSRTSESQFGPMTALHLAAQCRQNTADLCRMLIDKGVDINSREAFLERTPLYIACEHSDAEVIRLLVNRETFTQLPVRDHSKAILPHTIAINSENEAALDVLIQFESQCSVKLSLTHISKLVCEAAGPHTGEKLFEKLYENYADVIAASENSTHILLAAIWNADRVKYMLDNGCKPKAYNSVSCDVLFSLLTQATVVAQEEVLDLILEHITPLIVDLLNQDTNSSNRHPLIMTYCRRTEISNFLRRYAKLLKLGLDPKRAAVAQRVVLGDCFSKLQVDNGVMFMMTNCPVNLTRHHDNDLFIPHRYFSCSFSALTYHIFTIFNKSTMTMMNMVPEVVCLLLDYDASPNASCRNEMSPLLALLWRTNQENFKVGEPLREVFHLLVEFGVNVHERTDDSPFSSPDIAVAAACTGNEVVLQHCLENGDIDPLVLISDLMKLELNFHRLPIPFHNITEHTLRVKLRTNIGLSVRTVLPFMDQRATDLVNRVLAHFTDPIPPHIVESSVNDDDRETTIWREVDELANQTHHTRLKHICRVTIRRLLTAAGQRNLRASVASLDLPISIRAYLTFQMN